MTLQRFVGVAIASLVFSAPLAAQHMAPSQFAPVAKVAASAVVDSTPDIVADSAVSLVSIERALHTAAPAYAERLPELAPINANAPGGRNGAMMIVGGAALVVGSVIGGDAGTLMMVGGGVIGLVGLWRYLQ